MRRLSRGLAGLTGWRRALVAFLLGVSATAALPPLHFLPLLVVAFTGLVWVVDGCRSVRAAFGAGWWFGVGHFLSGLYWIANALLTDPERFGWMIVPALAALSTGLAVFPGLAVAAARAAPAGVPRVLALSLGWVAAEWLRGHLLTGFPWNLIGYAWAFSDAVIQLAALAGAWSLSLITVSAAAMPAVLASEGPGVRGWRPVAVVIGLLVVVWAGGVVRLATVSVDDTPGVRLRIVQPNVAQHHKWQAELRQALFERHLRLTRSPGFEDVTHVIWPETAISYFIARDLPRRQAIAAVTPERGVVIAGALRTTPQPTDPPRIWNSLEAVDPAARVVGSYDKFHLVPFGEYVPFRRFLEIAKVTYGSIDFAAGPGPRTLRLPGLPPVSPLICFEAIFPGEVLRRDDRPQWLLNITNDAWFGMSSGPYQHFASARLRAVEEGLPLVRAANTGISAVVDPFGRVTARLGLGEQGVLDAFLPRALDTRTPYALFGDLTLAGLLLLGLASLALSWRRLHNHSAAHVG